MSGCPSSQTLGATRALGNDRAARVAGATLKLVRG